MWFRTLFGSLDRRISPSPARKRGQIAAGRHTATRRLRFESLEDRRLLSVSPAVDYPVGLNPQAVAAADFNGDGRLDLAVVNFSSSNVSVLLGNANGTFQPAVNSATGASPLSVAVGDFNTDGKLDLATANVSDVSVLLGNGNGTFQAPTSISIGSSPSSVAVGDFNGDGKLDLGATSNVFYPGSWGYYMYYSGYYNGQANVLLGTGAGSFAAPIASYLGYGNHTSAAAADFNGDGIDDFATLNVDYGLATVLLGTVTGTLGAPTNFTTGFYPRAVTVGDFTSDGILDLATAGQTIDILPGYGNGTFSPVVRAYIDPVALAPADFNGDGKLDLVTADGSNLNVLLGLGTGALTSPLNHAIGSSPVAVAVGDFNGDGRPDVASANPNSNNVSVLLNDGAWPALDAPSIFVSDATVTEGNTGTVNANFTVSLSAAYSQTVTVRYATADGTATTADGDYAAASAILTFAPGQTSKTVTVAVNGDRVVENTETFSVRLSEATNAFIADALATGAILDDEPRITIDDASVVEGNSGTKALTFTVTLSAASDAPVTVDYATSDGSATVAGGDYQAKSGTVTFAAGQTSQTFTIAVNGDRLGEYDEGFYVNLTGATGAGIGNGYGYGTILDDEPRISVNSASLTEGNKGTKVMTFTVTLSAAYDQAVTVNYATQDGSAVAGSDYVAKTGTLTFAAGETSKTFTVTIRGDNKREPDESFYVLLSGASPNAVIWNAYGWGTILNDDGPRR